MVSSSSRKQTWVFHIRARRDFPKGYIVNWFLIQTKPNAHLVACEHLKRQGFDVFLPLLIKTSRTGSKFVNKTIPLFPSYLFMGTLKNEISWKSINSTRGVSKAVTLDNTYRTVNKQIIEGLKFRCNERGIFQRFDDIFLGDNVKIENGPFAEFVCKVDKISADRRVWVLIDILQQQTRIKMSINDLSRID